MTRVSLFNLAVNRAYRYVTSTKGWSDDAQVLQGRLESWYLKTRFAYRIPLDSIIICLLQHPCHVNVTNVQESHNTQDAQNVSTPQNIIACEWHGGEDGGWQPKALAVQPSTAIEK